MNQRIKMCAHCVELVRVLRGCGNTLGVSSQHYAMAAIISLREEGVSIGDLHALIDTLQHVDAFDRSPLESELAPGIVAHPPVDAMVIDLGSSRETNA
jgi:hypothetical protein